MYTIMTFVDNQVRYVSCNASGYRLSKKPIAIFQTLEGAQKLHKHLTEFPYKTDSPYKKCKIVDLSL